MFSFSYPFLGCVLIRRKPLASYPTDPMLLSLFFMAVGLLAINPIIWLHCVCYGLVLHYLLITLVGLVASVPVVSAHWPINSLLWTSSAHLLHLYLLSFFMGLLVIITAMSAHWVYHFIPWVLSAHLLLLYLFLLLWVYCLIPWTSLAHSLHLYLLLLLWAYWPLFLPCQPN